MPALPTFETGSEVEVVRNGEVIDRVRVVQDSRSEIEIERISHPGKYETFTYHPQSEGWLLIFEGLGGERCINLRSGPVYEIRPVTQKTNPTSSVATEMGTENLDDLIGTGMQ